MASEIPSNDVPGVTLLSIRTLTEDNESEIRNMDEKNRINALQKKIDSSKDTVSTSKRERVMKGARALSKGIKDNLSLIKSGDAIDTMVGVLNIAEGISAAIPPPYNGVGAAFGIYSDVLQIMQDKPSQIEQFKTLLNKQTKEITDALKETEINLMTDTAKQIGQLYKSKVDGAIALAERHLFSNDYLMNNKTLYLSDDKLKNIQNAIENRTALFGELRSTINEYMAFEETKQEEIDEKQEEENELKKQAKSALDDYHEAKDKTEEDMLFDKASKKMGTGDAGDFFEGLGQGILDVCRSPVWTGFHIDNKIKQSKKWNKYWEIQYTDIPAIEKKIKKMKEFKLTYINICKKLLHSYCILSLLHQSILYFLSFELLNQQKKNNNANDNKNYTYFSLSKEKTLTDYKFIADTVRLINYGIYQTGTQKDGNYYQVHGDGRFQTDSYEKAVKRYNEISLKWAKVMLCNGAVVTHYGTEKWVNIHIANARKDFKQFTLYNIYPNDDDEVYHYFDKANEAYEQIDDKKAKVLLCNGYVYKSQGDEKWVQNGIETSEKEFMNFVNVDKNTIQYLSMCNIQILKNKCEESQATDALKDRFITSISLSPHNYQPRWVFVGVLRRFRDDTKEPLVAKRRYKFNLCPDRWSDVISLWFNPLSTLNES